jgi:hypothetical protein
MYRCIDHMSTDQGRLYEFGFGSVASVGIYPDWMSLYEYEVDGRP